MFITVHAAAAAILGRQAANPVIAFILGLISHFVLDAIPHGDEHLGKKFLGFGIKEKEDFRIMALYGSIDSFFLAVFLIFLFKNFEFNNNGDNIAWAIVGGILPDILVAIYKLKNFKLLRWFSNLHMRNHRLIIKETAADIPLKYGVLMQVCFLIALIWLIYFI
ncbi:MAG: hypothetical protein WC518_03105 [Patescibacteria group bacterium]